MRIQDLDMWSRFYVPVPYEDEETEEQFLEKTKACLEEFFTTYTGLTDEQRKYRDPFAGCTLESLKGVIGSWNFLDFDLKEINKCNVDFYVGTPQDNYGQIGIDILTVADPEKRPMVDFLREKWTEFEYEF
ncbi:MAG: hypothetical protein GY861_09195 [bacterium]|nr:hypothetical protein [bacterium]